ncbi:MAG: hypothetical protein AB1345_13080 [Chloroflexota bacterium]
MNNLYKWLNTHKFGAHLIVFLLMFFPSIGLYYAAQNGHQGWIIFQLGLVILANILALWIH